MSGKKPTSYKTVIKNPSSPSTAKTSGNPAGFKGGKPSDTTDVPPFDPAAQEKPAGPGFPASTPLEPGEAITYRDDFAKGGN
jgi:hypothetical protein